MEYALSSCHRIFRFKLGAGSSLGGERGSGSERWGFIAKHTLACETCNVGKAWDELFFGATETPHMFKVGGGSMREHRSKKGVAVVQPGIFFSTTYPKTLLRYLP